MHIDIREDALARQEIARDYGDSYLLPYEVEAKLNDGVRIVQLAMRRMRT